MVKKLLVSMSISLLLMGCSLEDETLTDETIQQEIKLEFKDGFTKVNTNVSVNSVQQIINEGDFIHINNNGSGEIVWVFGNKLRHIQSIHTWNGLFNSTKYIKAYYSSWNNAVSQTNRPIGAPIVPENGIENSLEDGRVFLRIGSTMHYISGSSVFNKYQLNWNIIYNVDYIRDIRQFPSLYPSHYITPNGTYTNGGTLN